MATPNKINPQHSQLISAIAAAIEAGANSNDGATQRQEVGYHVRDDSRIDLPSGVDGLQPMPIQVAATNLARLAASEAVVFEISEEIDALPWDAACAFARVIQRRYGWADITSRTIQTFFGPKQVMPDVKRVKTGPKPGDYLEIPFGDIRIDGISGPDGGDAVLSLGFSRSRTTPGMSVLYVETKVRYSERGKVLALIAEVQDEVANNSIYRGKSMRLRVNDDGTVAELPEPEFIDLSSVDEKKLVHNRDTEIALQGSLFTPIRKTAECRRRNVKLKRTIMLSGTFGTGKTLTAGVTAKLAAENGWTYISVDKAQGLKRALEIAMRFQPAIVFVEDIDRVVGETRTEDANDILNVIDGILAKGRCEVFTVMTTNNVEKIHPAMLRPGRIDAIIPVNNPSEETIGRLIRVYLGNELAADQDLTAAQKLMNGMSASTVAEVCNRATLYAIQDGRERIKAEDIEGSATSIAYHASLLMEKTPSETDAEVLARSLKNVISNGAIERHTTVMGKLDDIEERLS